MIELYISPSINSHVQLMNRVEDNHIALKVINDHDITDPILIEGGKSYNGVNEINTFLDEFESIMRKWHACKCDDYEFN